MSASSQKYTLDTLTSRANGMYNGSANGTMAVPAPKVVEETTTVSKKPQWGGLTWLIIIWIIIAVLLYLFHPGIVTSQNSVNGAYYVNFWKLFLWSLLFALIIVLIIWLTKGAHGMIQTDTVKYA